MFNCLITGTITEIFQLLPAIFRNFLKKKNRNYGFFLAPDKFQHEIQETTNQGPTMRLQLCPSFPTRTRTEKSDMIQTHECNCRVAWDKIVF